jgi:hypothetical protein
MGRASVVSLLALPALVGCEDAPAAPPAPAALASAPALLRPSAGAPAQAPPHRGDGGSRCELDVLGERSCVEYAVDSDEAHAEKYCRRVRGNFAVRARCPSEGRAGVCLLPEGALRHAYGPGEHERYCLDVLHGKWGDEAPARDPVSVVRCVHEGRCEESSLHVAAATADAERDCGELGGSFAALPCASEGLVCALYGRRIVYAGDAAAARAHCESLQGSLR